MIKKILIGEKQSREKKEEKRLEYESVVWKL